MRTHRDEQVTVPVVLVKWYDWTKWLLDRVDSFPSPSHNDEDHAAGNKLCISRDVFPLACIRLFWAIP